MKVKKNLKGGAGALINAYNECREELAKKKKRSALRQKKQKDAEASNGRGTANS